MNLVFPHSHGISGRWVGLTLVVVLCLLDALCVDSAAPKRDLQFMEERLIGWLGETHHTETPSAMMQRLSQEEKDRGAWVEQLSWRPRA
jgi:hypothetical protein